MIGLAHAKDRLPNGQVAPVGKGAIDWTNFLHCLSSCRYNGPLIAHGMLADEAPDVSAFLHSKVELMK